MIAEVIQSLFPDWKPPRDTGREWVSCRCPFHGDSRASAGISFDNDRFNCLGCGVSGGPIKMISHAKGVTYSEAVGISKKLLQASDGDVPRGVRGKSSGGVSSGSGSSRKVPGKVSARVRSRTAPWS